MTSDPFIGRLVDGRYRIRRPLGRGGMGTVYIAVQESLGREVAVKIVTSSVDDLALERFRREARLLSGLVHPNVVTVHDFGVDDGQPYLVMELVNGDTLRRRLRGVVLPSVDEVLRIVQQIAAGLAAAHAMGVAHRDVKPENVVITSSGNVKLLDFGLAKRVTREEGADDDFRTLTDEGAYVGTPGYTAPELLHGDAPDDERACDLYALGVVLYEGVTRRQPFEGKTRTVALLAQVEGHAPHLRAHLPAIDPDVDALAHTLLARDPKSRPTAAHVASWLARRLAVTDVPTLDAEAPTERSMMTPRDGAFLRSIDGDRTLKIGVFDPTFALYPTAFMPSEHVLRFVMERLVARADDGRIVPAALGRFVEEAGGTRARVWLRDGARFGAHPTHFAAGRDATLDDVVQSLEHARRERPYLGYTGARVDGDAVVVEAAHQQAVARLIDVWLAPREVLAATHDDLDDLAHPVGTGRYRVVGRLPGGVVQFARRDDVTNDGPAHIELSTVSDPRRGLALVRDGALDLFWPTRADRALLVEGTPPRMRANLDAPDVVVGELPASGRVRVLALVQNRLVATRLSDRALRRDVARVIDRARVADALKDMHLVARGRFLPQTMRDADLAVPALPRTRDESVRITGPLVVAHTAFLRTGARALVDDLRSAGLEVESAEIADGAVGRAAYDAILIQLTMDTFGEGADLLADIVTFMRGPGYTPSPDVEALLTDVARATSRATRYAAVAALERALVDDLPFIPLAHGEGDVPMNVILYGRRVASVVDRATGYAKPIWETWRGPRSV